MRSALALFAVVVTLASCSRSDLQPSTIPATPVPPTIVPSPTLEPDAALILKEVPNAFEFVREGVYRGGDGVGGAAWLDYDNDGDLDLYVANTKTEKNALFRNDDGAFTNVAEEAGVTNGKGNSGVAAVDVNNDGCSDLFLSGDGGAIGPSWSPHKLYVNNCDGTFVDFSEISGITAPQGVWSAAFGDLNGDGYLDLFLGAVGGIVRAVKTELGGGLTKPSEIYLNNGDGTFERVISKARVTIQSNVCGVAVSDHDQDKLPDLFVFSCDETPPQLLRHNGDMTFTDVAFSAGVAVPRAEGIQIANARAATRVLFADYDLDQDLDIMALSYGSLVSGEIYQHLFLENNGDGTYTNKADKVGIRKLEFGWGATLADFDNDSYPDIYYVGQFPIEPFDGLGGNLGTLYLNSQSGTFVEEETHGFDDIFASGIATGDYNNDGYPDVVVVTAKSRGVGGAPILMRNRGGDNGWITVRLIGTRSNRDGVGARITISAGNLSLLKEVSSGFAFLSTESLWPSFGLGGHDGPVDIKVQWPSGLTEVFRNHPIRQTAILTEGKGTAEARGLESKEGRP